MNSVAIGYNASRSTMHYEFPPLASSKPILINGVNVNLELNLLNEAIDVLRSQNEFLRARVDALWYAPGMPGALGAKAEFEETRKQESE